MKFRLSLPLEINGYPVAAFPGKMSTLPVAQYDAYSAKAVQGV